VGESIRSCFPKQYDGTCRARSLFTYITHRQQHVVTNYSKYDAWVPSDALFETYMLKPNLLNLEVESGSALTIFKRFAAHASSDVQTARARAWDRREGEIRADEHTKAAKWWLEELARVEREIKDAPRKEYE
jgi:hypothetical protein